MPDVIVGILSSPYVAAFAVLPLIALWVIWSAKTKQGAALKTSTAYLVWALAGFVGFHRLYLRNIWWILYIPLLAGFLYAWTSESRADTAFANARGQLEAVDSATARHKARAASAGAGIEEARAQIAGTAPISEDKVEELELEIERENARATDARADLAKVEAEIPVLKSSLSAATDSRRFWSDLTFKALLAILAFMLIDAMLMPSLKKTAEMRANVST